MLLIVVVIGAVLIGSGFAPSVENKVNSTTLQGEPTATKTPTPKPPPTSTPTPTATMNPKVGGVAELSPDLIGVVEGTYTYEINPATLIPKIKFTLKSVGKKMIVGYRIVYQFSSDQGQSFNYDHAVPPGRFPPQGQITSEGEPGYKLQNPSLWTITVKVISVTFQ